MEPGIIFREKAGRVLSDLIKVSNSATDLNDRLEKIAVLIAGAFEVAFCGFFSRDTRGEQYILEAASNRSRRTIRRWRLDAAEAFFCRSPQERHPFVLGEWPADARKASLQGLTDREPRSLLALPVGDDKVVYGTLVLLHEEPRAWSEEEMDLLAIVGEEIAGALRNENIFRSSKKRIAELTALFEVEKVLGTTLEVENLVQSVASIISKVMAADGCRIYLSNIPPGSEATPVVQHGDIPDDCCRQAGLPGCEAIATGGTAAVPACSHRPSEDNATTIVTPLNAQGRAVGTVCIYRKTGEDDEKRGFTAEDVRLLSTIGSMIAKSLETAFVHADVEALARENERMVRQLSTLYEISGQLMTSLSAEEIEKTALRAITSDEGLGFDRAVIFLLEEQERVLREVGRSGGEKPAVEMVIPLNKASGTLAEAVRQKRALCIEAAKADPIAGKIWPGEPGGHDYGVVPVMAKDKVLGVIVVDNSRARRPIGTQCLEVLSMLGSHTGLALDNARLYTFLERTDKELLEARELLAGTEKLAAMGEMASTLAHEIRNPLVSVGGLARRAIKVADGNSAGRRYLEVIVDEVGRLEKTLNELLDYVREPEQAYAWHDLNGIIEECLELINREFEEGHITVKKDLKSISPVSCDLRQIKHTLFNILLNARQAMPSGGTVWVSSSMERDDEAVYATCSVKDTGGGIPEATLHNIFNPFFTTKKGGSGLGLAISYRIMSRHGGKIEVQNEPGRGVAFVVKMPLNPEQRVRKVGRLR